MDRFIVMDRLKCNQHIFSLKSNMDRFIVTVIVQLILAFVCLKSNMDRFIAKHYANIRKEIIV